MNIKKVEEKSMTIHIKKKPNIHRKSESDIHAHAEPDSRFCNSARDVTSYAAHTEDERSPKTIDVAKKVRHEKGGGMVHSLVKAAEVETTKTVSRQLDGGEEVHDAALLAYEVFRPISASAHKGIDIKAAMMEQKRKKYKIVSPVEVNRTVSKQSEAGMMNPPTNNTGKSKSAGEMKKDSEKATSVTSGKNARKTIKVVSKQQLRVSQKASEGLRTSGHPRNASNEDVKYAERKQELRSRKMKAFREKKAQGAKLGRQAGKKIVNRIRSKVKEFTGKAVVAVLGVLGGAIGLIAMVAIPVVLIITVLYNSPFALFLPSLDAVDTVQSVTNAFVSDFVLEAEALVNDHTGYDEGEIYYCDPDGNAVTSVPQKDIMCVYMVKCGIGDAATVMNNRAKRRLEAVVKDMCQYSTTDRTEVRKDKNGKKYNVTILEVKVLLKDYQDMILEYGLSQEQTEVLEILMNQ